MNQRRNAIIGRVVTAVLALALVGLLLLERGAESRAAALEASVAALRDSVQSQRSEIARLRTAVPGLGDYMSTIQLHASKVWFAVLASNWELAGYELGELRETFDGADALHITKNGVDISGVIHGLENSQLAMMETGVREKDRNVFLGGYRQTLDACNGCHRAAGNGFIHVRIPSAPPVTNQDWTPVTR